MNIVSLKIKNFLSIADVEIKPGQINQIVGKNNQGKTTILKALEFAVKGSADGSLVKFGEESAEVVVELDDSTSIRRRINSEGRQSVNVTKEGFQAKSPQSLLDGLFESASFNPLELLDPKKRADAILNSIDIKIDEARLKEELGESQIPLPPLDYSQHGLKVVDQAHKYFYQRRAEANKDAVEKKKRWETYEKDLPTQETTVVTRESIQAELDLLTLEQKEAQDTLTRVNQTHANAREARQKFERYCVELDKIQTEIESVTVAYEKNIAVLNSRKEQGQKFLDEASKAIPEALEDNSPFLKVCHDLKLKEEQTRAKFKDVERIEAIAKQKAMVEQMKQEWEKSQLIADDLGVRVDALSGPVKKKLMEAAEMPIAGLEYKDSQFLVEGVPVDNLSSSKALQLALGVAKKLAKKTKVICLDGAELLDNDTFGALIDQIKDDGYTYFITKVGDAIPYPAGVDTQGKIITMKEGQAVQ